MRPVHAMHTVRPRRRRAPRVYIRRAPCRRTRRWRRGRIRHLIPRMGVPIRPRRRRTGVRARVVRRSRRRRVRARVCGTGRTSVGVRVYVGVGVR